MFTYKFLTSCWGLNRSPSRFHSLEIVLSLAVAPNVPMKDIKRKTSSVVRVKVERGEGEFVFTPPTPSTYILSTKVLYRKSCKVIHLLIKIDSTLL